MEAEKRFPMKVAEWTRHRLLVASEEQPLRPFLNDRQIMEQMQEKAPQMH
jgi:hypothetical protein